MLIAYIIGVTYTIGLKFAGYAFAGSLLQVRHPSTAVTGLRFSFYRTLLGILFGVLAAPLAGSYPVELEPAVIVVVSVAHAAAWVLALLASPGRSIGVRAFLAYTAIGTAWSFLLDIPVAWAAPPSGSVFTMVFNAVAPLLRSAA
jgi:hypothetical protein